MSKITRHFFMYLMFLVIVACGSNSFRAKGLQEQAAVVAYLSMVERERVRVLPHLHYSLDAHSIDRKRGTIELSFYFIKEQGDSLLWVECVERVPLALIDTALCRRWLHYGHER